MSELSTFQTPLKITGPDGTVAYAGVGKIMNPTEYVSAEASATIGAGEAVRFSASSVLGRMDSTAGGITEELLVSRTASGGRLLWGVSMTTTPAGKKGHFAGAGSILCVKSLASGSLASNTSSAAAIASATTGSVDTLAANTVSSVTGLPAGGSMLGRVCKIAGTTGGATDTGVDTLLGVIVAPW